MIVLWKLSCAYKSFYRRLFKIGFSIIRKIVIFICAKDIEVILNLESWINVRSILFFYTNISVDAFKLEAKQYPVKRFKVKWYIWAIHYLFAAWVITKLVIVLTIFYSFRYVYKGIIFKHLWLLLVEHWHFLRLPISAVTLFISWHFFYLYFLGFKIFCYLYREKYLLLHKVLAFLRIYKLLVKFYVFKLKYFWAIDKHPCVTY